MRSPIDTYLSFSDEPILVGRAWFTLRRNRLSTRFAYDPTYLSRPDAFPIDPMLPLSTGGGSVQGLPGAFRDASPDRWGRHLILRESQLASIESGAAPRSFDDVDFLLGVADLSREGALRFRAPDGAEWMSDRNDIPPRIALPKLQAAASEVLQGASGLAQLKYLLDAGSGSLGGARPKASIMDGQRLLLAKFSHPNDGWSVMAWEKVALDVAELAGITVPRAELVWLGESQALLLERFDRVASRVMGPRIPYMSAMTLVCGSDGGNYDYADVAEQVGYQCLHPSRELKTLFGRVALNVALHNVDDHLRNLGYLRISGDWTTAPLFDCNPEPNVVAGRQTSIMGYGGDDALETAQALRYFAEECGLETDEAAAIVGSIIRATAQWDALARKNRIPERERRLFAPMFKRQLEALESVFHS